jgi:hypothetical protein
MNSHALIFLLRSAERMFLAESAVSVQLMHTYLGATMRWTVEGADKETGQERAIAVDADSKAQAERIASKRGLLVSDVHEPVSLSDAEKLEAMVTRSVESPQPASAPAPPPEPQQ